MLSYSVLSIEVYDFIYDSCLANVKCQSVFAEEEHFCYMLRSYHDYDYLCCASTSESETVLQINEKKNVISCLILPCFVHWPS